MKYLKKLYTIVNTYFVEISMQYIYICLILFERKYTARNSINVWQV